MEQMKEQEQKQKQKKYQKTDWWKDQRNYMIPEGAK